MQLEFLGAAGTVTGSMHLVTANGSRILLDCGLYQGQKSLREQNWRSRIPDPGAVTSVIVSHAHLDHSGYLPLLVRQGFKGAIYCTPGTQDLLQVVLLDAAHVQEEDAERANRHGYTKHHPALPLYGGEDARKALALLIQRPYEIPFQASPGVTATFRRAGHILGSATIELDYGDGTKLVYSGDLGRYGRPILPDPEPVRAADTLILESTYGNRLHEQRADAELAQIIRETASRAGFVLIPAFAVDRTQELLWMLHHLERERSIPTLSVYCDSPMATEVTEIYRRHPEDYSTEMAAALGSGDTPLATRNLHFTRTGAESRVLNDIRGPAIIIASSGMATGGRILHHLAHRLSDPRNTVLLVGYQAPGTRGRALEDGARQVQIFGAPVSVGARIAEISGLSAHGDREDLLRWLGGFERPPTITYLVHGEAAAAAELAAAITSRMGWKVEVAREGEPVLL